MATAPEACFQQEMVSEDKGDDIVNERALIPNEPLSVQSIASNEISDCLSLLNKETQLLQQLEKEQALNIQLTQRVVCYNSELFQESTQLFVAAIVLFYIVILLLVYIHQHIVPATE